MRLVKLRQLNAVVELPQQNPPGLLLSHSINSTRFENVHLQFRVGLLKIRLHGSYFFPNTFRFSCLIFKFIASMERFFFSKNPTELINTELITHFMTHIKFLKLFQQQVEKESQHRQ